MSIAIITITPTTNIANSAVIDNSLVEVKEYDAHDHTFHFYDIIRKKHRFNALINVSLYDDVIIFDETSGDVQYKILAMKTKNNIES